MGVGITFIGRLRNNAADRQWPILNFIDIKGADWPLQASQCESITAYFISKSSGDALVFERVPFFPHAADISMIFISTTIEIVITPCSETASILNQLKHLSSTMRISIWWCQDNLVWNGDLAMKHYVIEGEYWRWDRRPSAMIRWWNYKTK